MRLVLDGALLLIGALSACASVPPCDVRGTAADLAGTDAIDCGSANPYLGRFSTEAREFSTACMADALEAGTPFFGGWLVDCQLDTCRFEGRAYDGAHLAVLQQWILNDSPDSSTIEIVTCVPELRERSVTTPAGEVVRQEVQCGDITGVDEEELGECKEAVKANLEGFEVRLGLRGRRSAP
jgi:hypothetical protein